MLQLSINSEQSSDFKLKKILFAWMYKWAQEHDTTIRWMRYEHSKIARKLAGFFHTSALWQDAKGLQRVIDGDQNNRLYIESNTDFDAECIHLRGSLVICCHKKIYRKTLSQAGFHYKHGVRIGDIYRDLERYAENDSELKDLISDLEIQGQDDVFFYPRGRMKSESVSEASQNVENELVDNHVNRIEYRPISVATVSSCYPPPSNDEPPSNRSSFDENELPSPDENELPPPDENELPPPDENGSELDRKSKGVSFSFYLTSSNNNESSLIPMDQTVSF